MLAKRIRLSVSRRSDRRRRWPHNRVVDRRGRGLPIFARRCSAVSERPGRARVERAGTPAPVRVTAARDPRPRRGLLAGEGRPDLLTEVVGLVAGRRLDRCRRRVSDRVVDRRGPNLPVLAGRGHRVGERARSTRVECAGAGALVGVKAARDPRPIRRVSTGETRRHVLARRIGLIVSRRIDHRRGRSHNRVVDCRHPGLAVDAGRGHGVRERASSTRVEHARTRAPVRVTAARDPRPTCRVNAAEARRGVLAKVVGLIVSRRIDHRRWRR